ncbi:Isy1-like splicing factor [Guyanagaster necrorhizus]|uniref:Isy1-like splicing factor n=1 Tax=Guyanagaster necrorhizus TaxID=856835 RepID=A0A9P8ARM7_9AGAR|nr:Isy1-like splicing factor [Guyanagaster necrorhizus MCA 3950]KAG7445354.1 Isy1-like splicing factor [Guyanagaster necrorhizus MCA 3950]
MARNEEKAQSMLYRFREAQAAELGLGTRGDRRPRMASACKSLRECERWRGEILREISRKVSKIQDAGLTDYEVRDLNDEINKILREKRHWENQIVALGGANYRRNVAMLDDDGKEVPGTKGYKYFGRAKELPGVRELFQSRKNEEEEENQTLAFYKKFLGQGPAYYGDTDEVDGKLLDFERQAEEDEWEEAYTNLRESLDLPNDDPMPKFPRSDASGASVIPPRSSATQNAKRKVNDGDADGEDSEMEDSKRSKIGASAPLPPRSELPIDQAYASAHAAASYIPFLTAENLLPPKMPTRTEMDAVLLDLRKKVLVEEYFGEEK